MNHFNFNLRYFNFTSRDCCHQYLLLYLAMLLKSMGGGDGVAVGWRL